MNELMMRLDELDIFDPLANHLKRVWNYDPGIRTILYYSCLLGCHPNRKRSVINELEQYASLAGNVYKKNVEDLIDDNILDDDGYLNQFNNSETIVGRLILDTMGGSPFAPPFNGVEIVNSDFDERNRLWVQNGMKQLVDLFANGKVKGLLFQIDPIKDKKHEKGAYLVLDREENHPILVFMFLNTSRMRTADDASYLINYSIHLSRESHSRQVIPILAAPTYDEKLSMYLRDQSPMAILGPINLAILSHGLASRRDRREKDYTYLEAFLSLCKSTINASAFIEDIRQF